MPSQVFTTDHPGRTEPPSEPAPPPRGPTWRSAESWPTWLNIALGIWLFISTWAWPHSASSYTNTWVCGVLITLASIWALFQPAARWITALIAVWLFFSSWAFWHVSRATAWNNWILAIVVFLLAIIPTSTIVYRESRRRPPHPPATHAAV